MSITRRRIAVIGVAALAVGATLAVAPNAWSDAATTRSVINTGRGYVTKTVLPNGDTVQFYGATPVTITTPGTTSLATADGSTVHVVSGTATPDLTNVPTVNGKPVFLPTPSAYDELIALGAPEDVAAKFRQLDVAPVPTAPASSGTAAAPNSTVTPYSTIIDGNNCTSQSSDGGRVKMYGCDTTYRVGTSGLVWYLEDKFLATGTAHDTAIFDPDNLTGLKFGVRYGSGNTITHWKPSSTIAFGSCSSNTVSLTYQGVGISSTTTECPETFGVYDIGTTVFTAKWDGQGHGPSNGSRDTHGVDSVYNGASASPYPSLVWTYWWA